LELKIILLEEVKRKNIGKVLFTYHLYSLVAQLAEHGAVNSGVPSSSLGGGVGNE
jgi:hypothetical protein